MKLPADNLCHPGLLLDKWHAPWPPKPQPPPRPEQPWSPNQKEKYKQALAEYRRQKREYDEFPRRQLQRVTKAAGDQVLLDGVRARFSAAVAMLASRRWVAKTEGPLTLHLSRAGSFENAGIALHPLYGFAYLPGSGLKGMARFYARNVARAEPAEIQAVFGADTTKEQAGAAGEVVFLDAWPIRWPRLIVDIVNNHHREYYDRAGPPEDWEDPNPVNFLAVAPGAEFEFHLGLRRPRPDGERLLDLAQEWVLGALQWLGAGAKTNAGYGRFQGRRPFPTQPHRVLWEGSLVLVSPAFLAGAAQSAEDCDLRPATLRGLMRWWWRTLHAGYMDVEDLRELEGRLWGLASQEGAISISLQAEAVSRPTEFRVHRTKGSPPPGRAYLAYGMEGNPKENKGPRCFLAPNSRWKVSLVARSVGAFNAQTVLDQALCALWLLCRYGGVGAKCRRGFGSLDLRGGGLPEDGKACVARAAAVRPGLQFCEHKLESPSLHRMCSKILRLKETDVWRALDRLGKAYRSFTASHKRNPQKALLGLPRMTGRRQVDQHPLEHPKDSKRERHASPLHFRIVQEGTEYHARITALYSPNLPGLTASKDYLSACINHMKARFQP